MAMQTFFFHSDVYYGQGALEALEKVQSRRALIVTDRTMVELGFVFRIEKALQSNGATVKAFDEVEPDPSRETCDRGAEIARAFKPDTIVGLGGGSAIDVGKAVWALYETPPGVPWDELQKAYASHPTRREGQIQFVAIPSTSGTGSEMSRGGVITNRSVTPAIKRGIYAGRPHIAIVDPILPATMPPRLTACTGVDAFVHAAESVVSRRASDVITALALRSMEKIVEWLPVAVEDGKNMQAREEVHTASTMAGICMMAGHSLIHSTAHQLGGAFGVPHGLANAIMQPYVIAYNAQAAARGFADIAWHLGIREADDLAATRALIDLLLELNKRVGIGRSLKGAGIDEAGFMANLDAISENAFKDSSTTANPADSTPADIRELFLRAWRGDPIRI